MTEQERRNGWQVLKDILVIAGIGSITTHIVYKSNTNFTLVKEYLALAETAGLIVKEEDAWSLTEKGDEFILRVTELEAFLNT